MAKTKPERIAENDNVQYAKRLGCLVRKMNGLGARSWPDRGFWAPNGKHFLIEYKRVGEEPTPLQKMMINQLIDLGQWVFVIDDKATGRNIIDAIIADRVRYAPTKFDLGDVL
jgi:hypothetical protein